MKLFSKLLLVLLLSVSAHAVTDYYIVVEESSGDFAFAKTLEASDFKAFLLKKYGDRQGVIDAYTVALKRVDKKAQKGIIDRLEKVKPVEVQYFFTFAKNVPFDSVAYPFYKDIKSQIKKNLDLD